MKMIEATMRTRNAGNWAPQGWSPVFVSLGALALASVACSVLHRFLGENFLGNNFQFVFISAAAVFVCAYGGIWRGLFVAISGLLIGFYFFVQPYGSFGEPDMDDFAAILVYTVDTLAMLLLVEWLQRSKYETRILKLETDYKNKRLEEILSELADAEKAATGNAEKIFMLAATVPHIWSMRRADGKAEYFNAKLYESTGMPPGSFDGEGWTRAMPESDAELVREISRRVGETGVREKINVRLRLADGAYHRINAECSRLEDRHGKVIVWSGVATEERAARS